MKTNIKSLLILVSVCFLVACSTFDDDSNSYHATEAEKNLSGTWNLVSVTRNDEDITSDINVSSFKLNLNEDGTYNIENYLPFMVENPGTWSIDNPYYPFQLRFKENDTNDTTQVELHYPSVDGQRKLRIELSPGCSSNKYVYILERSNTATK
jgi:hypothetical protein